MRWKKITGWVVAIFAWLMVALVAGGYIYLQSGSFKTLAVRKLVEQADQATGGHIEIGALALNLSTLTARLDRVVLRGKEPAGEPPLVTVDEIKVGIKIQSLINRKFALSELVIVHPVAHIEVSWDGTSNLPQPAPNKPESRINLFDLSISQFSLTNGEINWNDRKIPFDADLHGLRAESMFEPLMARYRGSIAYDSGQLHYGGYASLPHSLSARFTVTPSELSVDRVDLKVGSSTAQLDAQLTNYSDPAISGEYSVKVHTQDFADMADTMRPAGDLSFCGSVHYHDRANSSWLRNVAIEGKIGSERLAAASPDGRVELQRLTGTYRLADGSLRVPDLTAESLGGRVLAAVNIEHLDTTPSSHIEAKLREISLEALQRVVNPPDMKRITLAGTLNGTADMAWIGPVSSIRARGDLGIHAAASSRHSTTEVPMDAVIHATYDGPGGSLAFHQTLVQIPATMLTAEGEVSKRSQLRLVVTSSDLRQLENLVSGLQPNMRLPTLSGTGCLNAIVEGSVQQPQVFGRLAAENLVVEGSAWRNVQLSFQGDRSRIALSNGLLESARQGRATFAATMGLRNWSYLPANSLSVNLAVQQLSVTDIEHIGKVTNPISGELSGNVSLSGSQLNPSGSGALQIRNAVAYDQPVQNLAVKFHMEGKSIVSALKVNSDAGNAVADIAYAPESKAYKLHLDVPQIMLQKLRPIQAKGLPTNGTVTITANGEGTIDDPQLMATIQLPRLDLQQQSISGVKAELRVANHIADLTFDSQVAQAQVRGRAHIALSGDYQADAAIDTSTLPLNVLLAAFTTVPQRFQAQAELHAALKGPLKDKEKLEAYITIPTLNVRYQSLQVGAAAPIRANLSHSVLTLQAAHFSGTGTSFSVQGKVPINFPRAFTLATQGSVDARIFRIFSPDLQSSGTVLLDVRTKEGAISHVQGQVRLQNIAITSPDAPLGLEKLNGTFNLDDGGAHTSDVTAEVGGGQASVHGNLSFTKDLKFNVALHAQALRLRYPEGLRSVLDSNLNWSGDRSGSVISGRVLISALSFTPEFDLASFSSQFGNGTGVPEQSDFADTVQLHVSVQSSGDLSATSSQVSLQGAADLLVSGTAQNPVLTGRANLTSGELFFRGGRYQLQRGIITFDDPNQTKPVLNISVTTTVEQYNLTLTLRGPLDMLTTSYTSDPPLATADIINLIARGQTTSESAAAGTNTDSILASQAAGALSGSLQQLAGFSSLQIDPLLGENNQDPSARVGVQQRVSKNFLFTFSTDMTQPGSEIVQGEYQINKRWSVSVARDQLGGVSVDGRFHTKF